MKVKYLILPGVLIFLLTACAGREALDPETPPSVSFEYFQADFVREVFRLLAFHRDQVEYIG